MSEDDRTRWNERYASGQFDLRPNARLQALAHHLPRAGRCLDLACGAGRNSLFLAERGLAVDAWDVSDAGLAVLADELARRAAAGQRLAVETRRVDLDQAPLPRAAYDLVVVTYFLMRERLADIGAAVRPGGLLFYDTYLDAGPGARHRPAHKLQPGELGGAFAGWEQLHLQENPERGMVTLLARKPTS